MSSIFPLLSILGCDRGLKFEQPTEIADIVKIVRNKIFFMLSSRLCIYGVALLG
jgi:hypothetical protein